MCAYIVTQENEHTQYSTLFYEDHFSFVCLFFIYNHVLILEDVLRRLARWKIHLEETECLCRKPSLTQRQTLLLGLQGQVVQELQAK